MVTLDKIGGQSERRACEFVGLSTDTKPTGDIPNGSSFFEIDTLKIYFYDKENEDWITA